MSCPTAHRQKPRVVVGGGFGSGESETKTWRIFFGRPPEELCSGVGAKPAPTGQHLTHAHRQQAALRGH